VKLLKKDGRNERRTKNSPVSSKSASSTANLLKNGGKRRKKRGGAGGEKSRTVEGSSQKRRGHGAAGRHPNLLLDKNWLEEKGGEAGEKGGARARREKVLPKRAENGRHWETTSRRTGASHSKGGGDRDEKKKGGGHVQKQKTPKNTVFKKGKPKRSRARLPWKSKGKKTQHCRKKQMEPTEGQGRNVNKGGSQLGTKQKHLRLATHATKEKRGRGGAKEIFWWDVYDKQGGGLAKFCAERRGVGSAGRGRIGGSGEKVRWEKMP